LLALDLKLSDNVNPARLAWQAGVGRSMFDVHQFLFDQTGCPLAGGRALLKLQLDEGMWKGFDFLLLTLK